MNKITELTIDPIELWTNSIPFTYMGNPYWGLDLERYLGMNIKDISKAEIMKKLKDDIPNYTRHITKLDIHRDSHEKLIFTFK